MSSKNETLQTTIGTLRILLENHERTLPHSKTEYDYCETQGFIKGLRVALQTLGDFEPTLRAMEQGQ